MLADFTLLLHETTDTLRRESPDGAPGAALIWISGMASPGKARLLRALDERLAPAGVLVHSGDGPPASIGGSRRAALVHVHAETDLEAMLEPNLVSGARAAAGLADLLVPVDWEAVDRSVGRICELLLARGVLTTAAGGV